MNIEEELLDKKIAQMEAVKRRRLNPYRAVMGKMPTKVELSAWTHDRWMDLIRFALAFIERDGESEVFRITDEKRKMMDSYLEIPNHPFQEFIWRIDLWLDDSTNRQYYYKLTTLTRLCLTFLKRHPSLIDDEMRKVMEEWPLRLGWALAQYRIQDTRAGEIVVRDNGVMDGHSRKQVEMPSVQAKMMESLLKIADTYELLAGSISPKELAKLNVGEKLKALKDLSFIFGVASRKAQTNHLTQININTKDARSVEEAMLDFVKKNNEKE